MKNAICRTFFRVPNFSHYSQFSLSNMPSSPVNKRSASPVRSPRGGPISPRLGPVSPRLGGKTAGIIGGKGGKGGKGTKVGRTPFSLIFFF